MPEISTVGSNLIKTPCDLSLLRCPKCLCRLFPSDSALECQGGCGTSFKIKSGVPILINPDGQSLFKAAVENEPVEFFSTAPMRRWLRGLVPELGVHLSANAIDELRGLLSQRTKVRVLIVGGGDLGADLGKLLSSISAEIIETDVVFGLRTQLIMDVHEIPFDSGTFDCCILQAVLEHVCDPYRAVEEIHRVLKAGGLVYAETPFMQQVHMGRYDFTRFTHLGHRRLFRNFSAVSDGIVAGAGSALAWAMEHFLLSLYPFRRGQAGVRLVARFMVWPLKYTDYLTAKNRRTFDAASGFFFLGVKSNRSIQDDELIALYQGGEERF